VFDLRAHLQTGLTSFRIEDAGGMAVAIGERDR
jgi:hypothetical protein